MNFLKVKDNEDFIFKFVILFLIFLFCYITIFLYYNYNYLFSYREGLKSKEENKTDLDDDEEEETIKIDPKRADLLKEVNLAFSNADGNREKTLEKIEWFKNYNKAMMLRDLYEATEGGHIPGFFFVRMGINKAYENGEIDKLIASFPLTEAESNSMSSNSDPDSGSGSFF